MGRCGRTRDRVGRRGPETAERRWERRKSQSARRESRRAGDQSLVVFHWRQLITQPPVALRQLFPDSFRDRPHEPRIVPSSAESTASPSLDFDHRSAMVAAADGAAVQDDPAPLRQ